MSACAIDLTQGLRPPLLLLPLPLLLIVCGREFAGVDAAVCPRDMEGEWRAEASAAAVVRGLGGAKFRGVATGAGADDADEEATGALS